MIFAALVALLVGGFSTAYLCSGEVRYLWRAGYEETRILQSRQPIAETGPRTPRYRRRERAQLQLVLDVRAYAARLGFEAGDTYTTFADVGRDTLLLVLSASPRNCICPHTWKYPDRRQGALQGLLRPRPGPGTAAASSTRRGLDTYLRPAGRLLDARLVRGSAALHGARRATRWSWPRSSFTRSPTTRST